MANPVSSGSPAQKQPSGPDLRGKLTRAQAAERLGVSISKVRTMEGKALHPDVVDGVHYFAASEVDTVACERAPSKRPRARFDDGQIAARVFYLIDHGKDVREIVQELEVPPQMVRTLYHEWKLDLVDGENERQSAADAAVQERENRRHEREAERETRAYERIMRELLKS
jgi:hypothetical protein